MLHSLHEQGVRESTIWWGFLRTDVLATVVPAGGVLAAALLTYPVPWRQGLGDSVAALGYFTLYTLCLTIPNQVLGQTEDQLNKPFRPLPRGLLTPRAAWWRWSLALVAFSGLGLALHLGWPTALWLVTCLLYTLARWDRWWVTKQLCMGAGVLAQLVAAWTLVGPLTPLALRWIGFFTVLAPLMMPLADLRDVAGDQAVGRRTLPICWGDTPTRWWLIELFGTLPLVLGAWLIWPSAPTLAGGLLVAWSWSGPGVLGDCVATVDAPQSPGGSPDLSAGEWLVCRDDGCVGRGDRHRPGTGVGLMWQHPTTALTLDRATLPPRWARSSRRLPCLAIPWAGGRTSWRTLALSPSSLGTNGRWSCSWGLAVSA